MILCLETATNICSVALCENNRIVSVRESDDPKSHASRLTIFIDEVLRRQGIAVSDLQAIAVSKGPGSYTGLRIGVSVAKGLAYGASLPLIAVDTTFSMFFGLTGGPVQDNSCDTLYCPMLDARRMEVYFAIYDCTGKRIKELAAEVINEKSFDIYPENQKIVFFGTGSGKLKNVIKRAGTEFVDYKISASHMCKPAFDAFSKRNFEDVAYFEPFYLKDFITTKPVRNILGI